MNILNIASSGIRSQQLALDVLGNNIANASSVGYKQNRAEFSEALASELRGKDTTFNNQPIGERVTTGVGVMPSAISTDFRQGITIDTQNPLDLAIQGEGFFTLRTPTGESAYSRNGSFKIDAQRNVVDSEGNYLEVRIPTGVENLRIEGVNNIVADIDEQPKVFGQILTTEPVNVIRVDNSGRVTDVNGQVLPTAFIIPTETSDIVIKPDGIIQGRINDTPTDLGMITLTRIANPSGLEKTGSNLLALPNEQGIVGQEIVGVAGSTLPNPLVGRIRSGALEQSNVDLGVAMTDMIQVQRAYQMNSRMVKNGDEMWGLANSIRR